MDQAVPIELPVWKDPQNFVIVEHVRDEARVFFRCWDKRSRILPEVGCLHFEGVWSIDATRFGKYKNYPRINGKCPRSYYLLVPESTLLKSLIAARSAVDWTWRSYSRTDFAHYIVPSHDFYYNIVASQVSFSVISAEDSAPYFARWDEV